DYTGTDTFEYTVSDGNGGTVTASVTGRVNNMSIPRDGRADVCSTDLNTVGTFAVLTNDSDPDGDSLSITSTTQGTQGAVAISGTSVTYTPTTDYTGTDTFEYTVSDGNGGTVTATVTVMVNNVNKPPVATADSPTRRSTDLGTFAVLTNDSDPDGDSLSITSTT